MRGQKPERGRSYWGVEWFACARRYLGDARALPHHAAYAIREARDKVRLSREADRFILADPEEELRADADRREGR